MHFTKEYVATDLGNNTLEWYKELTMIRDNKKRQTKCNTTPCDSGNHNLLQ